MNGGNLERPPFIADAEAARLRGRTPSSVEAAIGDLPGVHQVVLAHVQWAAGRPHEVREPLQAAFKGDPDSPIVNALIGYLGMTGGERVIFLERISDRWPELSTPSLFLGLAQLRTDPSGAARALQKAVELRPDDVVAWASLAEAHRRQGNPDAVQKAANTTLALNSSFPWKRKVVTELFRARRYRDAIHAARHMARKSRGLRPRLFPFLLPFVAHSTIVAFVLTLAWALLAIQALNGEAITGWLVVSLVLSAFGLVTAYAAGGLGLWRSRVWRNLAADARGLARN